MRVFFRFTSPAGPMTIKAGLGLTAHPSDTAEVCVGHEVEWPEGCDYSTEVIAAISEALGQQEGFTMPMTITVDEIEFCELGSSIAAFQRAAQAAVKSLFDIRPDLNKANREQDVAPQSTTRSVV